MTENHHTVVEPNSRKTSSVASVAAADGAIDDCVQVSCRTRKRSKNNNSDSVGKDSRTERERRMNIDRMYTQLRDLVPSDSPPKKTRFDIVDKTIKYVKDLKEEVKKLEKRKKLFESTTLAARARARARATQSETCSNSKTSVSVTVSNKLAFFAITSTVRDKLASEILKVFAKFSVEVLAANVSVDSGHLIVAVTVVVDDVDYDAVEEIQREILIL